MSGFILNDDQKKLHDRDLQFIDKTFQQYDEQLERWSHGDVQPTDFQSVVSDQAQRIMKSEDAWDYYVRRFIADYTLDQGQQESAWSVLRGIKEEAAAYREAHKTEFAELEAKYRELTDSGPKTDPKELEGATRQRKELDRKRNQLETANSLGMFNRLKQKLQGIPRADQRQAYRDREAKLQKMATQARNEFKARQTATQAATQTSLSTQPSGERPVNNAKRTPLRPAPRKKQDTFPRRIPVGK